MTREELIAAMKADGADTPFAVEIPRWGKVYVRSISVEEAEKTGRAPKDGDERSQFAILAAQVICDEKGRRLFDPNNPDDIALLARRRSADLMRIINAGTDSGN